jgi:hypothetical protein
MSLDTRLSRVTERIPLVLWVLSLGLLAWTSVALLPSVHRGASLPALAFVLLPLGPLVLGGGLWLSQVRSRFAPYVLLTAFPVSLALSISRFDHDTALATFSPGVLGFALLSLGAYLSAASALCAAPSSVRAVDHRPLGEVTPVDLEARKQTLGRSVLGVVCCGALALLVYGSWGTPAHFREHWDRAAPEGATLTALAAGIVGGLALSLVGPALRAERGPQRSTEQRVRRTVWLLLVALSGAVVYVALRTR